MLGTVLPFFLACYLCRFLHATCVDKVNAVLLVLLEKAKEYFFIKRNSIGTEYELVLLGDLKSINDAV